MSNFFDYIFCRVYKQYETWREDYPYAFAEGVVVLVQCFILLDLLTLLTTLNFLPRKIENIKYYISIVIIMLYIVNHYRYKKRYKEIIKIYDGKIDVNQNRNGIILAVFIVIIIAIPLVVGVLRNHLAYDI
jgi:hypothetical protein